MMVMIMIIIIVIMIIKIHFFISSPCFLVVC